MVSYIVRWMVSEWIDRQEYGILKVFSLIGYCLISHSIARQDFGGIYEWECVLNPDFLKML